MNIPDPTPKRPAILDSLLRKPAVAPPAGGSLLLALGCLAVYGALAGFFEGGTAIGLAAFKFPLVAAVSLLLCLPSFVVFSLVAGDERSVPALLQMICGLGAVVSLFLIALAPVTWLFSVSSQSLGFIMVFHVLVLVIALYFGGRYLRRLLGGTGSQWPLFLWMTLLLVVSLQAAAYFGPVLGVKRGERVFELRREFFLSRFYRVDEAAAKAKEEQKSSTPAQEGRRETENGERSPAHPVTE